MNHHRAGFKKRDGLKDVTFGIGVLLPPGNHLFEHGAKVIRRRIHFGGMPFLYPMTEQFRRDAATEEAIRAHVAKDVGFRKKGFHANCLEWRGTLVKRIH